MDTLRYESVIENLFHCAAGIIPSPIINKYPIGKWSGQCGRTTHRRCMAVLHDPESSPGRYLI